MFSQFQVKDLGIGRSSPIKIRLISDRHKIAHHGVVKKLAQLLCERVGKRQFEKKIKKEQKRSSEMEPRAISVKCKRVVSQRYPNIAREMKMGSQPDHYFTQFFQMFNSHSMPVYQHISPFTPYRKQENYKSKQSFHPYNPSKSSRKPTNKKKTVQIHRSSNWKVSKWETMQESLGVSFVEEN